MMEMHTDKTKTGAIVKRVVKSMKRNKKQNWHVDKIFAIKFDCHMARNIHAACQGLFLISISCFEFCP